LKFSELLHNLNGNMAFLQNLLIAELMMKNIDKNCKQMEIIYLYENAKLKIIIQNNSRLKSDF